MHIFQGVIFLFFGVGLLLVVYQSLSRGWLPCGPNGLKDRLEFHRDQQPLLYWLMFVVYASAGIVLTIYAVRLFIGDAEPLPLQ
jgi:hypothetical protein